MFKQKTKTILFTSITLLFVGAFSVFATWPDAPDGSSVAGWLGTKFNVADEESLDITQAVKAPTISATTTVTAPTISATTTVTAPTISATTTVTAPTITASGNIKGSSITSTSTLTATSTITGNGITSSSTINASGNISAPAFIYSSDASLKKNVSTLENSLEKVQNLRGVSFDWKATGETDLGFIAQEVETVYPDLVETDSNTGLKAVKYGNITAILVEAIKAQQAEIDLLKAEIEALKN